ncbi:hypothetical protein ABMA10_18595 [Plantibacter sp. RU18]
MASIKRQALRLTGGDLLLSSAERKHIMAKSSRSSKPSKPTLSKAGKTLASNSSSKPAKGKAGSTLGKG